VTPVVVEEFILGGISVDILFRFKSPMANATDKFRPATHLENRLTDFDETQNL